MEWNHGHGVLPSVIAKEFNWCYLGWYIGWISNRLDRHISKLTRIFEGHQPPILEWQLGRSASGRHFVCAQPNYGIALQDRWFVSEFRLQSSSSTQCSSWSPVCSIIIFVYGNVNINFPFFFEENNLNPPGICSINLWLQRSWQMTETSWHRWLPKCWTQMALKMGHSFGHWRLVPSLWLSDTEKCLRCGFTFAKHVGMVQFNWHMGWNHVEPHPHGTLPIEVSQNWHKKSRYAT